MTSDKELEAQYTAFANSMGWRYHDDVNGAEAFIAGARAGARLQAERDAKLVEVEFTGAKWDSEADSWAAHFAAAIRASVDDSRVSK